MPPPAISLRGAAKGFDGVPAVGPIDLDIEPGRFVTLFGPSGCGKSTLLRLVAGLLDADEGSVAVHGTTPNEASAAKQIGLVPQAPALLPWRSVLGNIRLPLEVNRKAGRGKTPVDPVALLERVGLGGDAAKRPAQLSGGMAQRVAIARAFAASPSLLLMDEPFSAIDELSRESLREVLLELWETDRKTVLFVTHSAAEAVHLSDEVVVLSPRPGRVTHCIPVPLPRPRPPGVEDTEAFWAVETQVRSALRNQGTS